VFLLFGKSGWCVPRVCINIFYINTIGLLKCLDAGAKAKVLEKNSWKNSKQNGHKNIIRKVFFNFILFFHQKA